MSWYQPPQPARIEWSDEENDDGVVVPAVQAVCCVSGCRGELTYGDGDPSIKRALVTLTRVCSCGGRFHEAKRAR